MPFASHDRAFLDVAATALVDRDSAPRTERAPIWGAKLARLLAGVGDSYLSDTTNGGLALNRGLPNSSTGGSVRQTTDPDPDKPAPRATATHLAVDGRLGPVNLPLATG